MLYNLSNQSVVNIEQIEIQRNMYKNKTASVAEKHKIFEMELAPFSVRV
jgi:hypothetical protein